MNRTCYSCLPTDDLLIYALSRDNRTDMEVELAQRLILSIDMLKEEERYMVHDPGRSLKAAS
jgi:hypothetical protein